MKKQRIALQKLSLNKERISMLTGQDQVLGGNVPQTVPPYCAVAQTKQKLCTAAADICQPSFLVTGCPQPPQTQGCPSFPPQCTVNIMCAG